MQVVIGCASGRSMNSDRSKPSRETMHRQKSFVRHSAHPIVVCPTMTFSEVRVETRLHPGLPGQTTP